MSCRTTRKPTLDQTVSLHDHLPNPLRVSSRNPKILITSFMNNPLPHPTYSPQHQFPNYESPARHHAKERSERNGTESMEPSSQNFYSENFNLLPKLAAIELSLGMKLNRTK